MNRVHSILETMAPELVDFTRELVRIRSYSGEEEAVIAHIKQRMETLGYDEVVVDAMGNLVGRIGTGENVIMFDAHVDTVRVDDETEWDYPPFAAEIVDSRLYGRGSVDMKSAAAAAVYAAAAAGKAGLPDNCSVFVSCTVLEEDCDGENLKHLLAEQKIRPQHMIICEPSGNRLATGHRGKAQIKIKTKGVSAHGSAPEKGVNAIYEMAQIISRVDRLSARLLAAPGTCGTVVASRISSKSASLNAVPFECEIYLDRRLALGETFDTVKREMAAIIEGKQATWEIGTLERTSWTGMKICYDPVHMPWQIEKNHPLFRACARTYENLFGSAPELDFWDFSTNAVTTTAMGIPTIGFGPGEHKLAHMVNENCRVDQIIDAARFYAALIPTLNSGQD